jgi:hypothetical protein
LTLSLTTFWAAAPDDGHDSVNLKHVEFQKPQVVMVMPEEVATMERLGDALVHHRPAALFDLGKSEWLQSFNPTHLARCSHFCLVFYDEVFDVICERVTCNTGAFRA